VRGRGPRVDSEGIDLGQTPGSSPGGVGEKRASIVLTPVAESLSAARSFVSAMLEVWECEDRDQVAALLTSEIVSNAVRHAASVIGLEVAIVGEEQLRVAARDEAPNATVARDPDRRNAEGGHGLHIVESLAQRWGVERYENYKVVWFETPVQPRSCPST
jgi:anti-sigma regulatory factor (Ser/Thr protein kinase)